MLVPVSVALVACYGLVIVAVTASAWIAYLTLALYALWALGVWVRAGRQIPGLLDPAQPDLPGVRVSPLAPVAVGIAWMIVFALGRMTGISQFETAALTVQAGAQSIEASLASAPASPASCVASMEPSKGEASRDASRQRSGCSSHRLTTCQPPQALRARRAKSPKGRAWRRGEGCGDDDAPAGRGAGQVLHPTFAFSGA